MGIVSKIEGSFPQLLTAHGLVNVEQLSAEIAKQKANTARWDLNVAILAYAVLTAVIVLMFEGITTEVVVAVAILGLATVWVVGWRRGKKLFNRFYDEEMYLLNRELISKNGTEAFPPLPLTGRETEILSYIANGHQNKQVALKLGISEQTIKNHISSILRKLDVNDRTQAVVMAMQHGWISSNVRMPPEPVTSNKN